MVLTYSFFFFNDTATTEIYTLSLHDALPICAIDQLLDGSDGGLSLLRQAARRRERVADQHDKLAERSEEHTSELQSRQYLVCRLLLEKKKNNIEYYEHKRLNGYVSVWCILLI